MPARSIRRCSVKRSGTPSPWCGARRRSPPGGSALPQRTPPWRRRSALRTSASRRPPPSARAPDVTGRWHALYSLARLRVARAVTTLLDALQDPQPMVRAVAVRGVSRALSDTAKLAPQDVVTRIRPLLADRDAGVRVNTLRALATFRDSAFAAQAAPLAAEADLNVAVAAETTLGVLGGGRAVEALQPGLTSPVFALRRQAVIALAQADSARGTAAATPLAADADWRWRSVAAEAFGAPGDRVRLEAQLPHADPRPVAPALQALA